MKRGWLVLIIVIVIALIGVGSYFVYQILKKPVSCGNCTSSSPTPGEEVSIPETQAKIIFLHHSTGQIIWDGGVKEWFDNYNIENATNFQIFELVFPKDSPYGWNNYPYDYYNIWVKNGDGLEYKTEPTLDSLAKDYDVIIFKHCFPVSQIEADNSADVGSDVKSVENYKLQYNALKTKMREFEDTKFIVWTGAVETQGVLEQGPAERAKMFFNWVKNDWDEKGDNIFIFDFYNLETDGGLYLKNEYAVSTTDSHPNITFAKRVAPIFAQRVVEVTSGKAD